MELNEGNINFAISKLYELAGLPGFPQQPEAIKATAKSLLRLVEHNNEVEHKSLGRVRPLDWLIQTLLDSSDFFPTPITIRCIYKSHFKPATELPRIEVTN